MLEYVGNTVYCLDLSSCAVLSSVHNIFHVSLLCDWLSNGVHADMPPIKEDGEAGYKVASIKGHYERNVKMQYLISFIGFDSSEDMWLTTVQLEHVY